MSKSLFNTTNDSLNQRRATLARLSSSDPRNRGGLTVNARTRRRAEQADLKRQRKKTLRKKD